MNIPKLRKLAEYVQANPEEFWMKDWTFDWTHSSKEYRHDVEQMLGIKLCDTTGCLAGTLALQSGHKIDASGAGIFADDWHVSIEEWAAGELELTPAQSSALFYGNTDAENVVEYIERTLDVKLY